MPDTADRTSPNRPGDRTSLVSLLRSLTNDLGALVRQEVALAKAEVRRNIAGIVRHISQLAIGGSVAVVGLLVLVAFLIVGLGVLLDGRYWLSSLIVAVLLLGVGGGLGYLGIRKIGRSRIAPEATMETLRETGAWAGAELAELKSALSGSGADGTGRLEGSQRPPLRGLPTSSGTGVRTLERSIALDRQHASHSASVTARPAAGSATGFAAVAMVPPPGERMPPLSMPLHKRIIHEIKDDDVSGQAAKLAYFMFASLPPALLVLFGITGFVGGGMAEFITERLVGALPGSADEPESAAGFLNQFVQEVVSERAPGPLSIGLLTGLWAASAVFVAASDSLNKAFDVVEDRSWFKRRAMAIGVMVGFVLLFVGASVMLVGGPQLAEVAQLGSVGDLVWSIVQWPLAFVFVILAFFLVYYVLPNRDQSDCRKVLLKASAIAAGLWLVATFGFRLYIANFGSYSATYGFVGAILVLLLWMYLTGMVLLIGGEVASEMEREA